MATSEVEIGNLALDLIGEVPIVSFDDSKKAARLLKRNYPLCRDRLLRSYRWNFAVTRSTLAPDSTAPEFGFTYAFRKPSDMLQFIGPYEDNQQDNNYTAADIPHKLEGSFILANENPLLVFYIRQVTDPTEFDAFFTELLSIDIAEKIGYGLTSGNQRVRDLTNLRTRTLADARVADAFEGTPEHITASQWVDAHDGYRYAEGLRNRNAV
jgi:hypothetical protein